MPRKLLVAIRLEVAHHFIEGSSARRFRWLEPPAAFGAAETPKTWFLDPYQLPGHGHASYRTRISPVCRASYKLNRTPEGFRSGNPLAAPLGTEPVSPAFVFVRLQAISIAQRQPRIPRSLEKSSQCMFSRRMTGEFLTASATAPFPAPSLKSGDSR
jgi:hypothetical protein